MTLYYITNDIRKVAAEKRYELQSTMLRGSLDVVTAPTDDGHGQIPNGPL